MPGAQLTDYTETYYFLDTSAQVAAASQTFDGLVAVGGLVVSDHEVVCDAPSGLSLTPSQVSQLPAGRKRALTKAGGSTFDQATMNIYLARNDADGFQISTEQQTVCREIMDLADGSEFNLAILLQAPTATAANNVTRGADSNLTIPHASIDDASVQYVRATKNGGYMVSAEGQFNQYLLQFTPSLISPMLDHA